MRDRFFLGQIHIWYTHQSHYLSVCPMCFVYVCCVCVHWGWGMWVETILKMESVFVRALLRLIARTDETTLFTSHKAILPRVGRTSHFNSQLVNHCGVGVLRSTESPLQTDALAVIYLRKTITVFTHCQLFLFVCFFHLLMYHLPEELGVFIRLPAEKQPPRKKVT